MSLFEANGSHGEGRVIAVNFGAPSPFDTRATGVIEQVNEPAEELVYDITRLTRGQRHRANIAFQGWYGSHATAAVPEIVIDTSWIDNVVLSAGGAALGASNVEHAA